MTDEYVLCLLMLCWATWTQFAGWAVAQVIWVGIGMWTYYKWSRRRRT